MKKQGIFCGLLAFFIVFNVSVPCFAQIVDEGASINPIKFSMAEQYGNSYQIGLMGNQSGNKPASHKNTLYVDEDTLEGNADRKTTSLTAGYIADVFSIRSTDGSYRFRFDGETTGLILSSKSSSLMLGYGIAQAQEHDGDIRSITADLNLGGNIIIFRKFLGLPIESFIPIRVNFGYRNLELLDNPDSDLSSTANIGTGSLGAGLGAQIRIPTGLPVLKDNITAFAHLVKSAGAIGDFESLGNNSESADGSLGGIRLSKSTDLNIEAKFERLLGGKTGVTAGMTVRWMHWTEEEPEDIKQILDVVSGKQEGLQLRATQTFFRVGINW